MKKILFLLIFLLSSIENFAQETLKPDEIISFSKTEQRDLKLHVFYPDGEKNGKNRAVVVSFFGGGWAIGDPSAFYSESRFYNSLGLVAICADYRLIKRDNTTPYECVEDGKAAIRFVRDNYRRFGIDPDRIVASGGSAGGHVAACTAMIKDENKQKVSAVPNALMLFNPVINTTKEGYGAEKLIKGRETELSPAHHVTAGLPPTVIFHGTNDIVSPYLTVVAFEKEMKAKGNDCTLIKGFGEGHGFYNPKSFKATNSDRNYHRAMYYSAQFLNKLGYTDKLVEKPTEKVRVACIGDSITFGYLFEDSDNNSYTGVLQRILGEDYNVGKFAVSGTTLQSSGNAPYINTKVYEDAKKFEADVVIVMLGTNDSKPMNWVGEENFEKDYTQLIKSFKGNKNCMPDIYICALTPSFYEGENPIFDDNTIRYKINPLIEKMAKKNKVGFIDCYTYLAYKPELFPDKIHPTIDGAARLAQIIKNAISQESKPIIVNY